MRIEQIQYYWKTINNLAGNGIWKQLGDINSEFYKKECTKIEPITENEISYYGDNIYFKVWDRNENYYTITKEEFPDVWKIFEEEVNWLSLLLQILQNP